MSTQLPTSFVLFLVSLTLSPHSSGLQALGKSLFTLFASLTYAYHYLTTLINKNSEY